MNKKDEALKLALEALEKLSNTNSHWWQEVDEETVDKIDPAIIALREALVEQPAPPPECQTEAEKTAFAFGWFKALESVRQQPAQRKPLPYNKEDMKGLDVNQRLTFKLGWKSAEDAHNIKEQQ